MLHYNKFGNLEPGLLDLSFNDWHHKIRLSYDATELEEQAKVFLSDLANNELSCYGFEILDQHLELPGCANIVHELAFEIVREKLYPNLPSRLKCLYAFDILQINEIIKLLNIENFSRFVEVEPLGNYHVADLNWLNAIFSTLSGFYNAKHYWAGEPRIDAVFKSPIWEYLIADKVNIVRYLTPEEVEQYIR